MTTDPNEVHLWRSVHPDSSREGAVELPRPGAQAALRASRLRLDRASLDLPERERAARFRKPSDGARFIHARSFLRAVLGHYLGIDPAEVRLELGRHGKPRLPADRDGKVPLYFNLSHSGPLVVCAVCRNSPVGIDVEKVRPFPELETILGRYLVPAEQRIVEAKAGADRTDAFFRFWTRKEALLKGLGLGLAGDPATLDVVDPTAPVRTSASAGGERPDPLPWTLLDLLPMPGILGALATRDDGMKLVWFEG